MKEQINIRYQLLTRDNMQTRTIIALVIINLTTIGSRARQHLNQERQTLGQIKRQRQAITKCGNICLFIFGGGVWILRMELKIIVARLNL